MKCKPVIYISLYVVLAMLGLVMPACSSDTMTNLWGTGRITPRVTVSPDVVIASGSVSHDAIPRIPASDEFSLRLTDLRGSFSHTWKSWRDYDPESGINASTYMIEAFYGDSTIEGFNKPWFYAADKFVLPDGATIDVDLDCRLSNSMWILTFSQAIKDRFTRCSAFLHSEGHGFVEYPDTETRPLFVTSGSVSLILDLELPDGKSMRFIAARIPDVRGGYYYDIDFDLTQNADGVEEIRVSFDEKISTDDLVLPLTEDFINSVQPELTPSGFASGDTVSLEEGASPSSSLAVSTPTAGLASLMLTVGSRSPLFAGLPLEVDLLNMADDTKAIIEAAGIKVLTEGSNTVVDYTDMPRNIIIAGQPVNTVLELTAVSVFDKISEPCLLTVETIPVDLTVVSVSKAVMGVNVCELEIVTPVSPENNLVIQCYNSRDNWENAEIISVTSEADHHYRVRFKVPAGQLPVNIRALYRGQEKFEATVDRVSPKFSISVEPYALKAYVEIIPEDESLRPLITSMVSVYTNTTQAAIIERSEEEGIVTIAGLSSDTNYTIRASVFDWPTTEAECTAPVVIRTEKCAELSNGSFEDTKETIKYNNLLSGGRYSQSIVPIFNQQNTIQVWHLTPRNWANTNAKTFCMAATNQNSWYMQPSAVIVTDCYSGGYAVKLTSTAWDADGEAIPDYLQESQPYVYFSRNIPHIRHRAAGRLFIGSYSYDVSTDSEIYNEGMEFHSRPSAVSGFYKYLPSTVQPSDKGLVEIEVIGEINGQPTVIGRGRLLLTSSTSYRAFSVPVDYIHPRVKATRLKLMFASTENVGTIEYESANIQTLNNPVTASSLGSELWIDEISLSY